MKLQELINKINSLGIIQTNYPDEQSFREEEVDNELEKLNIITIELDVEKHRWYETAITVYEHEDGLMGIRFVTYQFSEQSSMEDHFWTLEAFEMEEVKTVTYRRKKK